MNKKDKGRQMYLMNVKKKNEDCRDKEQDEEDF